MSRRRDDELVGFDPPPSNEELARKDYWVWVEGREYVVGTDEELTAAVDRMRIEAAKIGLVVQEQDAQKYDEGDPLRRKWASRNVSWEEAAAVLQDHPEGLTIEQFRDELYREPGWTEKHARAAIGKTHMMFRKLVELGWATRRKVGDRRLLFSTKLSQGRSSSRSFPPAALALAKQLVESGLTDERVLRSFLEEIRPLLNSGGPLELSST